MRPAHEVERDLRDLLAARRDLNGRVLMLEAADIIAFLNRPDALRTAEARVERAEEREQKFREEVREEIRLLHKDRNAVEARAERAEKERDQQERFKMRANRRADRAERRVEELERAGGDLADHLVRITDHEAWAAPSFIGELLERWRAALDHPDKDACEHEWVDMRNEVIESGEMCAKCHAIRPADHPDKGRDDADE